MPIKTFTRSCIQLAFLFLLPPGKALSADSWVEVKSPHFIVSSNAGEREARRIANQFEEIRSVFQTAFASLRVDFGKPLIIIAVKNEDSLKVLLPDFYAAKDRMRPAGMYVPGFDRNFAVLRTDISGSAENPYHSLYHEYTHGIIRLNFPALPTWLDEGFAEFYGNTVVESGETGVGRVSKRQLGLLRNSQFIPIQTLMNVDYRSPQYNERDRVNIFYAESWALVHFLMTDPEARKGQLLPNFLKVLSDTNDSEKAARQAFGDLNKFGEKLETYTHQPGFYYEKLKPLTHFSDKEYAVRPLSIAEVHTLQADFLEHTGHSREAKTMLADAIQQQPTLAGAYSALGLYDLQQHDNDVAEKEFAQAVQLDPGDFRSYYYLAELLHRRMGYQPESTAQIIKNLEKVIQINPDFAPAHAFLSVAYRQQKETKEKALAASIKAAKLDPTRLTYVADIGEALLALGRDADARFIGEKMTKRARTPFDKAIAESFNKRLMRYEAWKAQNHGTDVAMMNPESDDADEDMPAVSSEKLPSAQSQVVQQDGSAEGLIREAQCYNSSSITIRFAILGDTLVLTVPDLAKIEYLENGKASTFAANPCSGWGNRKARINYKAGQDKKFSGEVVSIDFL